MRSELHIPLLPLLINEVGAGLEFGNSKRSAGFYFQYVYDKGLFHDVVYSLSAQPFFLFTGHSITLNYKNYGVKWLDGYFGIKFNEHSPGGYNRRTFSSHPLIVKRKSFEDLWVGTEDRTAKYLQDQYRLSFA